MNCHTVRENLSAYLDGELPLGGTAAIDRDSIESHVRACPACAEDLSSLRRTVDLVRSLRGQPISLDLSQTIRCALERQGAPEAPARGGSILQGPWARIAFALAAAAALLVIATLRDEIPDPGSPSPFAPPVAKLDPELDAERPPEPASTGSPVVEFFLAQREQKDAPAAATAETLRRGVRDEDASADKRGGYLSPVEEDPRYAYEALGKELRKSVAEENLASLDHQDEDSFKGGSGGRFGRAEPSGGGAERSGEQQKLELGFDAASDPGTQAEEGAAVPPAPQDGAGLPGEAGHGSTREDPGKPDAYAARGREKAQEEEDLPPTGDDISKERSESDRRQGLRAAAEEEKKNRDFEELGEVEESARQPGGAGQTFAPGTGAAAPAEPTEIPEIRLRLPASDRHVGFERVFARLAGRRFSVDATDPERWTVTLVLPAEDARSLVETLGDAFEVDRERPAAPGREPAETGEKSGPGSAAVPADAPPARCRLVLEIIDSDE